MITGPGAAVSDSARRAEIIYAQARSQIDRRLWRAALGGDLSSGTTATLATSTPLAISTLIGLLSVDRADVPAAENQVPAPPPSALASAAPKASAATTTVAGGATGLGNNAHYSPSIISAAERTGIPAAALASIIDAEAGRNRDGTWQTAARNTRSTAAGLGQFLSGTWKSEAERAGTWLNGMAQRNGWIDTHGQVLPSAHVALLNLRNDAEASINATADYASNSIGRLAAAGIAIGKSADQIARAAYLGHNLGVGDAIRFLRGGLGEGRARHLLDAQVGATGAARRIAKAGGASAAHRGWLLGFINRHVDSSRFSL